MQTKTQGNTQNTEATAQPIRNMYISIEEYSRVVEGLGTQLALQSRMLDHVGDQLQTLKHQNNNQAEYIQQLKSDAVEREVAFKKAGEIISSYVNAEDNRKKEVLALKAQVQYYKSKCKK